MKKFLFKLCIFLALPATVVIIYFVADPFKVLYHYDQYFRSGISENIVSLNKDYVSTEVFLNNYKKYHYDSYIFGNSRSIHFHVSDWQKHITAQQCFHFDATAETLYGIEKKMIFLKKKGVPIRNALFVLDYSILRKITNGRKHLYIKHPALSGESRIAFQLSFFKDFFDPALLSQYLYYLGTHDVKAVDGQIHYLKKHTETILYDSIANELYFRELEEDINGNPDSFYAAKKGRFYTRKSVPMHNEMILGKKRIKMLMNISNILYEQHTNYKIIINPLYDQVKLDSTDMTTLVRIFGKEHVFDFSGVNDITNDIHNYYEISHYRPFVATRMLDSIYAH